MRTEGIFAPGTVEETRERFESVALTADVVVRVAAKEMGLDGDEYDERVTDDVVDTAQEALFASLLSVQIGSREEYEDWRAEHEDLIVHEIGGEHVDRVVWHRSPFDDEAVAATFQEEADAAAETLRRQAFARFYHPVLEGEGTA